MATTQAQLFSKFKTLVRDPNQRIWSNNDQLLDFANIAIRSLQSDCNYNLPENQGQSSTLTFTGAREYALPSDYGRFEIISNNNDVLTPEDEISFERAVEINASNSTTNGLPTAFYHRGSNIGFLELPTTGTATLYYKQTVDELALGGTLSLADYTVPALLRLMAYEAYNSLRGTNFQQEAVKHYSVYKNKHLPEIIKKSVVRNPKGLKLSFPRRSSHYYKPLAFGTWRR